MMLNSSSSNKPMNGKNRMGNGGRKENLSSIPMKSSNTSWRNIIIIPQLVIQELHPHTSQYESNTGGQKWWNGSNSTSRVMGLANRTRQALGPRNLCYTPLIQHKEQTPSVLLWWIGSWNCHHPSDMTLSLLLLIIIVQRLCYSSLIRKQWELKNLRDSTLPKYSCIMVSLQRLSPIGILTSHRNWLKKYAKRPESIRTSVQHITPKLMDNLNEQTKP